MVVFQPHRYTRTRDLLEEFATAFNDADVVLLTEIYAAGEDPIPGVTGQALAETVRAHGHHDVTFASDRSAALAAVLDRVRPGDIVVTLGAGDITKLGPEILAVLAGKGASV